MGGECGFTRTGFIQIVSPGQEAALQANVRMQQAIGIAALVVTAEDVKRLAPGFIVQDFNVAAYEPESGYAMPSDSANALMDAARRKGALLVQDCAVIGILESGGKVTGVQTSRGQYSAPVVVNAAGAWAGQVNRMAGLDLPLTTWRHETMYVRRPREERLPHPTVIDFSLEMYFRPEGGLTLVGLEDGNPLGESPDSDVEHAREGFVERAVERLCKRMPRLEKGSLHSAHGGYDGITPDQHPLLGAAGPDGFYLDCGHSGTGFKTAPAVGKCLAELILDGKAQTVDITPLRPGRFAEGQEVRGNYQNIWR